MIKLWLLSLIRGLILEGVPELNALVKPAIRYAVIDGDRVVHHGHFAGVTEYNHIPWQITLPIRAIDPYRPSPPMPWEVETYYRHRGSTDPVIYYKLHQHQRTPNA